LDIRPVSKGHALLIPKKHAADLLDTDDESLGELIVRVKRVAAAIMSATGAAGFNLGVNTKPAAGQVVFHTHFHIIPRFANDGLKMWPHSESEPRTRAQMAEEIKNFIN
jgi:histidine triad (HIT) family protein